MRLVRICSLFLLCVCGVQVPARAYAAKPAQATKNTLAHDGRAHSYWASESKKRWRKQLAAKQGQSGRFNIKTQGR